jgi:hypothetical protein
MIGTGNMLEDYKLPAKHLDGLEDVVTACNVLLFCAVRPH